MSATIITKNKTIIDIHIVWDGAYCFLNKKVDRHITADARPIDLAEAQDIVAQTSSNPDARISSRGRVSFDNSPQRWSWMATIITDAADDNSDAT